MGASPCVVVDVRDMLCAQALAAVAQALAPLRPGEAVEVRYNTEDVKRDLLVFAKDRGHAAVELGTGALRIERR